MARRIAFQFLLAAAALWHSVSMASGQVCTFTISNVNFGNIDVTTNSAFFATAIFAANCSGNRNRTVRVCPNIGSGGGNPSGSNPRSLSNGSLLLSYNLYQDSGYATIWGSHLWPYTPRPPTIDISLSPAGSGTASRTIYARISGGQQTIPALAFASLFTGGHTAISYAYATGGNSCASIGGTNATQAPFRIDAVNAKTCRVTAGDLNFGSVSLLSANIDQTSSAAITCTNQTPYRVLLSNGLTGTGPTNRKMTLGAASVTYGLYRDASRTLAWGNTSGVNSLSGTGSGLAQSQTVYGRAPPQVTPPPGAYSDTVVMTVEY